MKLYIWLERQLAAARPSVALATPVLVFVVLDLAAQIAFRSTWASDQSLLSWEWATVLIPILVFVPAYAVTVIAVAAQMKRTGWWRLLDSNQSLDAIRSLSWREFERLVAAAFTEKGWSAELVGQAGPDKGLDLMIRRGKQQAIVQCKQRRYPSASYVTEKEVREFAGVIAARKAPKGFLVTSGVFAPEAVEFAEKVPQIDLIAGDELLQMVGRCPKCKAAVEPKQGKFGLFLSCVRYPACDGALNLAA
jgi:ssDNA-binding Zn-finger/Zn-ribbon topoisomerase 1